MTSPGPIGPLGGRPGLLPPLRCATSAVSPQPIKTGAPGAPPPGEQAEAQSRAHLPPASAWPESTGPASGSPPSIGPASPASPVGPASPPSFANKGARATHIAGRNGTCCTLDALQPVRSSLGVSSDVVEEQAEADARRIKECSRGRRCIRSTSNSEATPVPQKAVWPRGVARATACHLRRGVQANPIASSFRASAGSPVAAKSVRTFYSAASTLRHLDGARLGHGGPRAGVRVGSSTRGCRPKSDPLRIGDELPRPTERRSYHAKPTSRSASASGRTTIALTAPRSLAPSRSLPAPLCPPLAPR